MISPSEYVQLIKILYRQHSNPDVAQGQMKYMKFQFDYFGLKAPVWVALLKEVFKKNGVYDRGEELAEFVQLCYDEPQREMQYAAIEMVQKNKKKLDANFIETLVSMILQKSWWDSVDWIAVKLVSVHLNKFPELLKTKPYQWIKYTGKTAKDPDMWLQRTAI
ncbi:MAG: DNA alkylation repair protein, partial [Saprospiraceae bacterium]|nr:DNA alkylation repair protein [Saprospiraceae bacterium]